MNEGSLLFLYFLQPRTRRSPRHQQESISRLSVSMRREIWILLKENWTRESKEEKKWRSIHVFQSKLVKNASRKASQWAAAVLIELCDTVSVCVCDWHTSRHITDVNELPPKITQRHFLIRAAKLATVPDKKEKRRGKEETERCVMPVMPNFINIF